MSGGTFEYTQWQIDEIADQIERLIKNNNYGTEDNPARNYSKETIKEFKKSVKILRKAAVFAQRIDWLCAGDDNEKSFHERLQEELKAILK